MRWFRNEVIQSNMKICVMSNHYRELRLFSSCRIWDGLYNVERCYIGITCNKLQKIYIRKPEKRKRKKNNFIDDFK
jgi:hypothetical protein